MKAAKKPRAVKASVSSIEYGESYPVELGAFDRAGLRMKEAVYVVNAAWMREHRAMKRDLRRLQFVCRHTTDERHRCIYCGLVLL